MTRKRSTPHYLVDGYNVIHRTPRLSDVVDKRGLAASRRVLRSQAERFARGAGTRVRLIFDGTLDPMSHSDSFANQWIEVSFTSPGEEADERLVAVALEMRRQGESPITVSDDEEGVCGPLRAQRFRLISTAAFVRLLAGDAPDEDPKASALSEAEHLAIEAEFLAREAERLPRERAPQPSTPCQTAEPTTSSIRPSHVSRRSRKPPPVRSGSAPDEDPKASALSPAERLEIEAELLARDAERARKEDSGSVP